MTDRRLYVQAIPSDSQTLTKSQLRRQLASFGAVSGGQSTVESISLDPGEQRLRGQYRGKYAAKMASELEELFSADGITTVPYYGVDETTTEDGYYALGGGGSVTVGRLDPREDALQEFDGTLTKEGTRASQWRAVATEPTSVADRSWAGNTTTALVGVPAAATQVQWFDASTGATADPSVVETRQCEFGAIEIYDAEAAPYSTPTLIYGLDYAEEGGVDCRVWDDRGAGLANRTDSEGVLQWQKVYRADHEFAVTSGALAIVDSGRLRLAFDESAKSLTAQRWDDAAGAWSDVALGSSNWVFATLDVQVIGAAVVEAQVTFRDPSQSPTATYTLEMLLPRGYASALWLYPVGEGPVPSGLQTLLDPIASAQTNDPQPSKGLVAKSEVNHN